MGFLDKAKQLADQAQQKLDEVQKDFNKQSTGQQASGPPTQDAPAVEYDKHGRPVQPSEPEAPVAPPAAEQPAPPPQAAPPGEPAQQAEPAPPPAPAADEEGEDDPGAPPKMTSGDPLAG
jgi:hypothetical protein